MQTRSRTTLVSPRGPCVCLREYAYVHSVSVTWQEPNRALWCQFALCKVAAWPSCIIVVRNTLSLDGFMKVETHGQRIRLTDSYFKLLPLKGNVLHVLHSILKSRALICRLHSHFETIYNHTVINTSWLQKAASRVAQWVSAWSMKIEVLASGQSC